MGVTRGDLVLVTAPGDCGKPRPALIVQADLFNETHQSVAVCLITSHLTDAPLFRVDIKSSSRSGLTLDSQVMVDKITTLDRTRLKKRIGSASQDELQAVDRALAVWLGLERPVR